MRLLRFVLQAPLPTNFTMQLPAQGVPFMVRSVCTSVARGANASAPNLALLHRTADPLIMAQAFGLIGASGIGATETFTFGGGLGAQYSVATGSGVISQQTIPPDLWVMPGETISLAVNSAADDVFARVAWSLVFP